MASKSHLLLSEESTGRSDKNSKSCLALRHISFLSGQAGAPTTLIKGLTSLLSKGASLPTPSLNALLSLLQLPCLWVGVATEDVLNNESRAFREYWAKEMLQTVSLRC